MALLFNEQLFNCFLQIADFGVSDIFEGEDDMLNRFAGSPAFQAPEATAGKIQTKDTSSSSLRVLSSYAPSSCPTV